MHIWWVHVHMYTKYEVSASNHVPGGGVHRWWHQRCQQQRRWTIHDCKALRLTNQISQKLLHFIFSKKYFSNFWPGFLPRILKLNFHIFWTPFLKWCIDIHSQETHNTSKCMGNFHLKTGMSWSWFISCSNTYIGNKSIVVLARYRCKVVYATPVVVVDAKSGLCELFYIWWK